MKHRLGFIMVAAALATACSGGESSSTPPTSPASQVSATANGTTGTTADGTSAGSTTATITGTISAFGGSCPSVTFKLEGKTIKTDATTSYPDKTCADLKNGVRVGVTGTAQSDGSILAKQVKFAPPPPPPAVVTEGTVSGLSGTCPTITFTVASKSFTTDAQTRFGDLTCAAVQNGAKVAVQSQATTAGAVRVLNVKVIPPPPPPPVITEGTVSGLSGTCPTITFTVASKSFTTDAQTRFGDLTCAAVQNGAKVAVQSQATTAGAVRVLNVKVIPPPPPPPVITEGTVSGLSGTCPVITFTVAGKTFTTDAQTRFGDLTCAAVQNGAKVAVQTQATTGGAVRVLNVKVIPPPPPPPVVTEGTVSGLSGTCPVITFTVAGKTFTTDAQTRFGDAGCAAVKNDAKVAVQAQATTAGAVRVLNVKVIPPPPPPPTILGEVTAVAGTCPAITITFGSKVAVTSATTVFDGKPCTEVKVGAKVGVYGTIASGATTLAATKIVFR